MQRENRPRGFEDRLLSELRTYVSERNQNMNTTEETPAKTSRFGRTTKFSLAGAVGAVALGIGAIVALPALTASPAYAVEQTGDGLIKVTIHEPREAKGLEAELAEHGVQSQVDYLPNGKMCNPDRYTHVQREDKDFETITHIEDEDGGSTLVIEVNPDNYRLGGDITLLVELTDAYFTGETPDELTGFIDDAKGEIGDCDPIDAPEVDLEPEDGTDGQKGTNEEKKDDDGSKDKD